MKILIISPYEIYPPFFGGQVRIYNLAKNLSLLNNDVTVVCNYTGFVKKKDLIVDGIKIKIFKTYIQDIAVFLNSIRIAPLIISYPFHKLMVRFYKKLFEGYDIVQFEQPFLSCWMNAIPNDTLKVYSSQNVELDFDLINFKKSLFYHLYKKILTTCEKEALDKSNLTIVVSLEDKLKLEQVYHIEERKFIVIENGFDPYSKKINKSGQRNKMQIDRGCKVAVFLGSSTPPNIKAVNFITTKIAPQNRDIIFFLLGSSAEAYNDHQLNVHKVGKVKQIDKYLAMADIGLLPVIEGSGSNLKLLNYIKFNLQVISTNFGIRGYKDLKKYLNILPLEKFSYQISKISKKDIPSSVLKKYEWKNLALKLNGEYKKRLVFIK